MDALTTSVEPFVTSTRLDPSSAIIDGAGDLDIVSAPLLRKLGDHCE